MHKSSPFCFAEGVDVRDEADEGTNAIDVDSLPRLPELSSPAAPQTVPRQQQQQFVQVITSPRSISTFSPQPPWFPPQYLVSLAWKDFVMEPLDIEQSLVGSNLDANRPPWQERTFNGPFAEPGWPKDTKECNSVLMEKLPKTNDCRHKCSCNCAYHDLLNCNYSCDFNCLSDTVQKSPQILR